jgi:hypothetical protein
VVRESVNRDSIAKLPKLLAATPPAFVKSRLWVNGEFPEPSQQNWAFISGVKYETAKFCT